MDMNKMLQQVQQMQEEMAKAQEELGGETVEASVGGGMVTVKANGNGEIVEIKIKPEAIDPDDPESLEDLVVAGVNEALRNVQELVQARLGGAMGGLGGLGLPGSSLIARLRALGLSRASLILALGISTVVFTVMAYEGYGGAVLSGVVLEVLLITVVQQGLTRLERIGFSVAAVTLGLFALIIGLAIERAAA